MVTAVQARRGASSYISLRTVPASLRPALRAFLLGYASAVGPRLFAILARYAKSKRAGKKDVEDGRQKEHFAHSLRTALASGLKWNRFPSFCALLAGGSTFLEVPLQRLLRKLLGPGTSALTITRLGRWFATFFSAALSLRLLQSRRTPAYTEIIPAKSGQPDDTGVKTVYYGGRTLDLTLFAAVRALDVLVRAVWARSVAADGSRSKATSLIGRLADPAFFAVSSGAVMWAWFYAPSSLPRSYREWISSAAEVDPRLIEALRRFRTGEMRYGEDTGQAELLSSMAADYGLPPVWGDPAVSVPFPCELVHLGCGPSCEFHALSRFYRSFRWSLSTYLPLTLALQLRRKPTSKSLRRAVLSAVRSSAFLGTFITLFYYGVCLSRTRVGPRILGTEKSARVAIDGGICVATGCTMCGWSVLIEAAQRRPELALFVAPRALATFLPRKYAEGKEWRETAVFAASAAVVFCAAAEDKGLVRGVLGKVVGSVLER